MGAPSRPRFGSLQFYPRKRANRFLPSVNWSAVKTKQGDQSVLGFITYKVGMASAIVKDNTPDSMTKGKRIVVPVTVLEAPNMKILSVRFYKFGIPVKDVVVSNDKELKRIVRVPKSLKPLESEIPKEYDDLRVIAFSIPKQTSIKKAPDLIELAVNAPDVSKKLEFVKSLVGKEISLKEFLSKYELLDARGLTKGKGLEGAVPRFGITLKSHKAEKGRRRAGSLGPWHPMRVIFRVPQAGQLGMFSRTVYNIKLISSGNIKEKNINPKSGFKNYGVIQSNYILVKGSIQGPKKRQVLLTPAQRPTKSLDKKKYEFLEVLQ